MIREEWLEKVRNKQIFIMLWHFHGLLIGKASNESEEKEAKGINLNFQKRGRNAQVAE